MVKITNCKDIKGFLIFSDGRVFNIEKGSFVKPSVNGGYYAVTLNNGIRSIRKQLHVLIANHFIDNKDNKSVVNHIDGNKFNNDISNLEWVTHSENIKHAHNSGLIKCKISRKLSPKDVRDIYSSDSTLVDLKNKYNVSLDVIRNIKNLKLKYFKLCVENVL